MNKQKLKLEKYGIKVPEVMLPEKEIDMKKWGVIACDQYTSQKEYWEKVSSLVGDSPSSLNLIFPECYLKRKILKIELIQ